MTNKCLGEVNQFEQSRRKLNRETRKIHSESVRRKESHNRFFFLIINEMQITCSKMELIE